MRTIRVSSEVWAAIESHGKFGETPDDVLRKQFGIQRIRRRGARHRGPRQAVRRQKAVVEDKQLVLSYESGPTRKFPLPPQTDKMAIKKVRDAAVAFALDCRATEGQIAAVKKALTDAGYHITK